MSAVSIVMVTYHTGPALDVAISAALLQPECLELILVDNGNPLGVRAQIEHRAAREPRLKYVNGHGNVGFAAGCNLGVRHATGEILLFLNPDSMLPEGGLARALETLRQWPENTLAGCHLVNPDGTEQRGGRRSILTPRNALAESFGIKRLAGTEGALNFHGTPMPGKSHEVPAISGAFMMLSRRFYDQLGGLDEGYFLHMEDMDLCRRVHLAEGKVILMPEVRVIHFRSTSEASSAKVEYHKTRGFARYLSTHFATSHSPAFLALMRVGLWGRYGIKTLLGSVDRFFESPLTARRQVARVVLLYRLAVFGPQDDSLKDRSVLVIGGSGQTGLCVVGKALARGARVTAIYHHTAVAFSHPRLQWVRQNITAAPLKQKADIVIHAAALWQLPDTLESLIDGGSSRIIAFGSTSMFVKVTSKNEHEKETVAKLEAAEARIGDIAKAKDARITILRPTLIYGVGLDANVSKLADVARRLGFLVAHGEANGLRQPVQALDLATAALDIADSQATYGKAYNLGGSQRLSYRAMLLSLFEFLGIKPRIVRPPMLPRLLDLLGSVYQVGHINGEIALRMNRDMVFDIAPAVADFGYRPKGFLQGDVTL